MSRRIASCAVATVLCVVAAAPARADTSPIGDASQPPWVDPNHQTPTELLAGQIASRIANRPVSVRCEDPASWPALVSQWGGGGSELGVVLSYWHLDGQLASIWSYTEIRGDMCAALEQFAAAASKPTKCSLTETQFVTTYKTQRTRRRKRVRVKGKVVLKTVWVTTRVPVTAPRQVQDPPAPCYLGDNRPLQQMPQPFWDSYTQDALAMLVLAHESIHLGGAVGGVLSNGVAAGDQQAEAHANCWGMQWIPFVAEQLGDTSDDAQAIAEYVYDYIYPTYAGTEYWSAACVPGGAMDIRPPGSTAWP